MQEEIEIWKPIPISGNYEASSLGRIRNVTTGTILCQRNKHGYLAINMEKRKGKSKMYLVHRLVCLAFLPNPENKPCVNHKDGVRTNNRLENLEWVTHRENSHHARIVLGWKHLGKLSVEQAMEIKILYSKKKRNGMKLAIQFKVSDGAIYKIINGQSFKTYP